MKWAILSMAGAILLALGLWTAAPADAPDEGQGPPREERRDRPQRERGNRQRDYRPQGPGPGNFPPPPPHPLEAALDSNGDREISAEELANASASLKKCDKNSDGMLDRDELRPPFPPGPPGAGGPPPGSGQRGPRGNLGPGGGGPPQGGGDCPKNSSGGSSRRGPQT